MTPRCSFRCAVDWISLYGGFLEPLTKFQVRLHTTVSVLAMVAAELEGEEAKPSGDQYPYR